MKSIRIGFSFSLLLLLTATLALANSPAKKSFDQLRTLVGSWSGKNSAGTPLQVSIRSTSADSALVNEVHGGGTGSEDMFSVFHLDGDRLVMTHYCTAGNQPRMAASVSPDGKTITFEFFDATNLANPDAGHMERVVIEILDVNHHTETWTFIDHGKEMKDVYDLRRSEIKHQ
jgi:hypothetical protein